MTVTGIHDISQAQLHQVVDALNIPGPQFRARQRRQQHRRQNRNDGDDDKEFNEREPFF